MAAPSRKTKRSFTAEVGPGLRAAVPTGTAWKYSALQAGLGRKGRFLFYFQITATGIWLQRKHLINPYKRQCPQLFLGQPPQAVGECSPHKHTFP